MSVMTNGPIFPLFKAAQQPALGQDTEAVAVQTVEDLLQTTTNDQRPGMLLGKIQSGKTRTFVSVIALGLDNGFDVAIVFTKGTKALTRQTVARLNRDLAAAVRRELVLVYDIQAIPEKLTEWELNKKLVIVCKKEDDNLRALEDNLILAYPQLADRRVLIVDDEADFASVGYRRTGGVVTANVIPTQIDSLRRRLSHLSFLQVTATPYSLYLQPDGEIEIPASGRFLPVRPAFTRLVPVHDAYIGGDYYFDQSQEQGTVASFLHVDVAPLELEVLKELNVNLFDIKDCLVSPRVEGLRRSIVTFIVGAWIRRWQQGQASEEPKRYSFIVHTEIARKGHRWQAEVVERLLEELRNACRRDDAVVVDLLRASYDDLQQSIGAEGLTMPSFDELKGSFQGALDAVMTTTVNYEQEIATLLDDSGQLQLRTPYNIFIGGQILDRGLTIDNLIGFFYGRRPKTAQADTVLQHSRMYGSRPKSDLAVTRFYTTRGIYRSMEMINEFDAALRSAVENGGQDAGVYFLRADPTRGVIPCSPNKLLMSEIISLRSGSRLFVPPGFNVKMAPAQQSLPSLDKVDQLIAQAVGDSTSDDPAPRFISIDAAEKIVDAIADSLDLDTEAGWDTASFKAALRYLANANTKPEEVGKVVCLVRRNRDLARVRPSGRLQDAPDYKADRETAERASTTAPGLLLFRQNGSPGKGWNGPFWWPVMRAPLETLPIVFAGAE